MLLLKINNFMYLIDIINTDNEPNIINLILDSELK